MKKKLEKTKKIYKTPKFWTAKAWAEHMLHISGFTDAKEVKSVSSNTREKVPRKSNKSKQSSKAAV
nr:hypothetical protein [uncultured Mediterranean phage uvMED]